MPRATNTLPYKWLAEYYDQFFAPFRAPIDAARQKVLGGILPRVMSACDLACGTGTTAVASARQGIKMFAADLSPVMCRLAREKAQRARAPLRVIRADMRNFRLPEPVDLVTCEYDAVNHVPKKEDLRMVAGAVARALKPGGYFFFDVNNRLGFEQYWSGTIWVEQPGVVLVCATAMTPGTTGHGATSIGSSRRARCGDGIANGSKKSAGLSMKCAGHSAVLLAHRNAPSPSCCLVVCFSFQLLALCSTSSYSIKCRQA